MESLKAHSDGGGKCMDCVKNISLLSPHDLLSAGCRLFVVLFITGLNSNLCTALTTHNITERENFIFLHPKNVTAHQTNEFLTGMYQFLITSKGQSAFASAKHSEGQLQTLQSLSVL
jgi:hypothetical protein